MTIAPPDQVTLPAPAHPAPVRPSARHPVRPRPGPARRDPPRAAPGPAPSPGFRPELHGLRALAVALVVVYHVWFDRVSGGVDVFFLLTGFLLVDRLARAAAAGPLPLRRMWARNAARLLPAATTVLLGTLAAAALVLPSGRLVQTLHEVVASLLFVENWQLAADSVDYAARNNTSSVVQHFWSLSIQGQVLVTFPLLVALVATAGRGPRLRVRLAVCLGALSAASLAFSAALTATDQPLAYFHTLTRLWEFGLGGLLALGIGRIVVGPRVRTALGWAGVLGLVACGAVLQVGTMFPGIAALWPTGCAALVLVAATTPRWGVDRLLATAPVQYLGELSYTLYLWHWPVLILVLAHTGRSRAGLLTGLAVIVASLAAAALTHHLVERRGGRRVALAGLVAVLVAATSGFAWTGASTPGPRDDRHPGALVLAGMAPPAPRVTALPPMTTVYRDWVHTEQWDCVPLVGTDTACTQPVADPPQRRIVVVGDSHMQQFVGALEPLARHHGWQLTTMLRGGCPFSAVSELRPEDRACLAFNDAALGEIARLAPDAVVTMATRDVRRGLTEELPAGFIAQWERLAALDLPVVALRDNPRFDQPPPDCLQRRGREAPACGASRAAVYSAQPPWSRAAVPANVAFVDTADLLCGPDRCPAEVGNVLVYMDDNHLSATFAATLAPVLDQPFRDALGW
ncbi:MAG: acyltransferase family protein [Pseudonocardia sp.]